MEMTEVRVAKLSTADPPEVKEVKGKVVVMGEDRLIKEEKKVIRPGKLVLKEGEERKVVSPSEIEVTTEVTSEATSEVTPPPRPEREELVSPQRPDRPCPVAPSRPTRPPLTPPSTAGR